MTRTAAIANLAKQIEINAQFPHVAAMVVAQRAKLARWEAMSDEQFDAEQAVGRAASVRSMARSLRR